jgi:hypothetical protein
MRTQPDRKLGQRCACGGFEFGRGQNETAGPGKEKTAS